MTWRGTEVDDSKQSILPAACYVQMPTISQIKLRSGTEENGYDLARN